MIYSRTSQKVFDREYFDKTKRTFYLYRESQGNCGRCRYSVCCRIACFASEALVPAMLDKSSAPYFTQRLQHPGRLLQAVAFLLPPTFKLVYRLAYNGDVAAGQLAVFQGASEAPISGFIRVERATRKNGQLAAARRVALKMGRRLRCSSVTYRFRYAPSSRLADGPF
jgi:hypothetical protein